jgi:hypothetical protein
MAHRYFTFFSKAEQNRVAIWIINPGNVQINLGIDGRRVTDVSVGGQLVVMSVEGLAVLR